MGLLGIIFFYIGISLGWLYVRTLIFVFSLPSLTNRMTTCRNSWVSY